MSVKILGVSISTKSPKQIKKVILQKITRGEPMFIATVNPSFLVKSYYNKGFKNILNSTSINVADGVGIQVAAEYKNCVSANKVFGMLLWVKICLVNILVRKGSFNIIKHRLTGVELVKYLLSQAGNKKLKVLVYHYKDSLLQTDKLVNYILSNYKGVTLKVIEVEKNINLNLPKLQGGYDITLCTLGEYKQELMLQSVYKKSQKGIFIGIGGAFDVITSKQSSLLNKFSLFGVEWLYRLVKNPKRVLKIYRSVILFSYLCVFKDTTKNDA